MVDTVYFDSLGGGVDSTFQGLAAMEGLIKPMPEAAFFADTGAEPGLVMDHLSRLEKILPWPVIRVKPGNYYEDILDAIENNTRVATAPFSTQGLTKAGKLTRQCSNEYKLEPIRKAMREYLGYKPRQKMKHHVELRIGITTSEAGRMKDSKVGWITNKYPIVDLMMSRADCRKWLKENWVKKYGHPMPIKSACVFCPYHSNEIWRELKYNSPRDFAKAIKIDEAIRHGLPKVNDPAYLHRTNIPIKDVNVDSEDDRGPNAFMEECEGICGL